MYQNIAVIGGSGAIGSAFIRRIEELYPETIIHSFSRSNITYSNKNIISYEIDYTKESSIMNAAEISSSNKPFDMVFVATGILHDDNIMPEKSLKELSADKFHYIFAVNTILPALIIKYFLPKLTKEQTSVFGVISARVGSISDNYLGGWYSYRASKAALNMIIKNSSIELSRQNKKAIIIGLHPGTVDSKLSKPFQKVVSKDHLFSPDFAVMKLLNVMEHLSINDSGKCFAWDGSEIAP